MLGRFELRRKLGEGGMGAVFEAFDPRLGRGVALKVLRDDRGRLSRPDISHEARMLARVSHPNIVTVYELGEEADEAYVCMEYVDGPHLASWIAEHPQADWRRRVQLLLGAAAGLAAAHRAGVIHRDFKLENVLIGSDGVPRVTDFGLARMDRQTTALPEELSEEEDAPAEERPSREMSSSLAGTPGYMAPELSTGASATERSDQYSFFVALRMALQGVEGTGPAALAAVIRQGTSPEPEARLADMPAVIAALEALLAPRSAADQRARDVLMERVQRLWVEPVRARALRAPGAEMPLRCEAVPELLPGQIGMDLGAARAEDIATTLHTMLAGVVLVGAPGAGKTIRLLGVADVLLRRARDRGEGILPVVLNLSTFPSFRGTFLSGSSTSWWQRSPCHATRCGAGWKRGSWRCCWTGWTKWWRPSGGAVPML
jgi:predicted Ser/Thr protein kinase